MDRGFPFNNTTLYVSLGVLPGMALYSVDVFHNRPASTRINAQYPTGFALVFTR
jgi:hypothetical protein